MRSHFRLKVQCLKKLDKKSFSRAGGFKDENHNAADDEIKYCWQFDHGSRPNVY